MTLKKSQGHQTQNDSVDPKQGYNHAKFEIFSCNAVQEQAIITDFFLKETCQSSPYSKCNKKKGTVFMIY